MRRRQRAYAVGHVKPVRLVTTHAVDAAVYTMTAAWAAAFGICQPDEWLTALGLFLIVAPTVSWAFAQDRDWSRPF